MEITQRVDSAAIVLNLSGRLDLAGGTTLKEYVDALLAEGKCVIHLNMSKVEFITSSGLGALVSIMKASRLCHGRLTLSNLQPYTQEIFDITQLTHIFYIFNTEEEALTASLGTPI